MCLPATALVIAATAVSAAGAAYKGYQTSQQENYEAKVATANASQQTAAAQDAQEAGQQTLRDQFRRAAALKGDQIAAQSANGIDASFGSALTVQQDTAAQTSDDALTTDRNVSNQVRGYEVNASNYTATAASDRSKASGALVGAAFDVGSTILGGAKQYQQLQASKKTGFG